MEYEVWIATMNEATVNTQNLPNAEQTTYSTQFSMGALFRSQNGSLWTENQYQDMKFKLYKANFTSTQEQQHSTIQVLLQMIMLQLMKIHLNHQNF